MSPKSWEAHVRRLCLDVRRLVPCPARDRCAGAVVDDAHAVLLDDGALIITILPADRLEKGTVT